MRSLKAYLIVSSSPWSTRVLLCVWTYAVYTLSNLACNDVAFAGELT